VDLFARYQDALAALASGAHERATEECVWLWSNARDPSWHGVRYSFLLASITELIAAHAPARAEFVRLRDAHRAADETSSRSDWLALNQALGDEEQSVAWFDELERPLPPAVAREIESWLSEPLRRLGRWADVALLYPDPVEDFEMWHQITTESLEKFRKQEMSREESEHVFEEAYGRLRDRAAFLVQACTAAGRSAEADRLREKAFELDPTPEMQRALESPGK